MCSAAILFAGLPLFLLSLTASAQVVPAPEGGVVPALPGAASPVSGAPPHVGDSEPHVGDSEPHVGDSEPQVVPTPPTVIQPSVANDAGNSDAGNDALASSLPSPATPAAWTRLTTPITVCTAPPKIDGRLDDTCWKTATRASGFYRLGGTAPIQPGDQTEAWICADATHLYVAFHCLDAHPELIHTNQIQRDGSIGEDDYVSVDVDSQNNHHGYSTFSVTARGTQAENFEGGDGGQHHLGG